MARRYRRFGAPAQRRHNGPPKPIEVKVGKLDFTGLTQAYDWAAIDTMLGLKLAFGWYDANVPFLLALNPLDAAGQKTYDRATKARKLGEGTVIVDEQKQAFSTALHLFEKLFTGKQPNLPLLDPALAPDAKPSKYLAWQQLLLEAFKVFQPFGLTYVPSAETERVILPVPDEDLPVPMSNVHVPITELSQMNRSVLSVLMKEAVEVAKQASIVEIDGVAQLDGNAFLVILPKILEAVATTAGGKNTVAPTTPKVHAITTSGSRTDSSQRKIAYAASMGVQLSDSSVIHLLNVNGAGKFKGLNAIRFSAIRDGMTLREYRTTLVGKIEAKRCGTAYLRDFFTMAVKTGCISIS